MTKQRVLNIDYETFSEVSLPDVGTRAYAMHPSTYPLMCAYAFDDWDMDVTAQWVPEEGEPIPAELEDALLDERVIKHAWNAPFEIEITEQEVCEVNVREWRDTMVLALSVSLPGKLETASKAVGLPQDRQKDARGKTLMRRFSFPRKPSKNNPATRFFWYDHPEEWEEYKAYNRRDVVAERGVLRRLRKWNLSPEEWELWHLDQEINRLGLPVNLGMVNNAIRLYEEALGDARLGTGAFGEMAAITGLENPNSATKQLLPWLQSQGYMFDDMKKGHIRRAAEYFSKPPEHWSDEFREAYTQNEDLKRVLELRLQTSRTSIKKYYAFRDAAVPDPVNPDRGRICYTLQMNGAARTGRWGGRIVQPQNLPRPEKRFETYQASLADDVWHMDLESLELVHGNVFDVLASAIRPIIQAPDGYVFVDADLSAIENRVLGWLARCDKILRVFRDRLDPYISFATYLYGKSYEELWHEYKVLKDGTKRTIGKPGTLGCGYGMGPGEIFEDPDTGELEATGLVGYAWNMGVRQFTVEDSKLSVDTFRREFVEVKDYWYDLEREAKRCVRTGKPTEHDRIRFEMDAPFLKMILPSGRSLYYLRPRLEDIPTPWGEKRLQMTYEGQNDKKVWTRLHMTPGKFTENADQAISRDLLVHGMKIARKRGVKIPLHVHDQIVGLVREDEAEAKLKVLIESMEEQPAWARDLPLGSAGHIAKVFIKD